MLRQDCGNAVKSVLYGAKCGRLWQDVYYYSIYGAYPYQKTNERNVGDLL